MPSVVDPSKQGASWWLPTRTADGRWNYEGVDAALEVVSEANAAQKRRAGSGFAGVLGFSQGGALASLLVALREDSPLPSLRFAIFAGAFRYRATDPCYDHLFDERNLLTTPSLHCIGARDEIVKPHKSGALADCFAADTRVLCEHRGSHVVPTNEASLAAFDDWLLAQQKAGLASLASEWSNGSYC